MIMEEFLVYRDFDYFVRVMLMRGQQWRNVLGMKWWCVKDNIDVDRRFLFSIFEDEWLSG